MDVVAGIAQRSSEEVLALELVWESASAGRLRQTFYQLRVERTTAPQQVQLRGAAGCVLLHAAGGAVVDDELCWYLRKPCAVATRAEHGQAGVEVGRHASDVGRR